MNKTKVEQLFSNEVEQLATKNKLGTLQKSYTKTNDEKRLLLNALVWMSTSILGMIFVIALVLRLTLPGPQVGLNNYLTAALLAIIGIVILYGCFRQGLLNLRAYQYQNREQVHIYTDGMVYLEGLTTSLAIRWDQIEELMRGDIDDEASGKVNLDRIYLTRIDDHDAQIFFQPTLPQGLDICAEVEQAYTEAHLPALLKKYHEGIQLRFSDLVVSQMGISIPSISATPNTEVYDDLSWNQLDELGAIIEVEQPYTTIKVQDTKNSIRFREFTCEIANTSLLKALLAAIKQ